MEEGAHVQILILHGGTLQQSRSPGTGRDGRGGAERPCSGFVGRRLADGPTHTRATVLPTQLQLQVGQHRQQDARAHQVHLRHTRQASMMPLPATTDLCLHHSQGT